MSKRLNLFLQIGRGLFYLVIVEVGYFLRFDGHPKRIGEKCSNAQTGTTTTSKHNEFFKAFTVQLSLLLGVGVKDVVS